MSWQNTDNRFEVHIFTEGRYGVFDTFTGNFALESGSLYEASEIATAMGYARALNALDQKVSNIKLNAPEPIRRYPR